MNTIGGYVADTYSNSHAADHGCSMQRDPVCGMAVTEKSFHHLLCDGQSRYFCSAHCKSRFSASGDCATSTAEALISRGIWALALSVNLAMLLFALSLF